MFNSYKTFFYLFITTILFVGGSVVAQEEKPEKVRLEPSKVEVFINQGETQTHELRITNTLNHTATFTVDVEDMRGTTDGSESVVLLGGEPGKHSLKDFVSYPSETFVLNTNETAVFPVQVTIPADVPNGGLYGSVLFTVDKAEESNEFGTNVETRLGALFFVRVGGEFITEGQTEVFETVNEEKLYVSGKPAFITSFRNTGDVHINPYGGIAVRNIFGKVVNEIEIVPWFVLPGSLRTKVFESNEQPFFGRYTATLELNRGYEDVVDERTTTFWVISWKAIVLFFAIMILVLVLFRSYRLKQYAKEN